MVYSQWFRIFRTPRANWSINQPAWVISICRRQISVRESFKVTESSYRNSTIFSIHCLKFTIHCLCWFQQSTINCNLNNNANNFNNNRTRMVIWPTSHSEDCAILVHWKLTGALLWIRAHFVYDFVHNKLHYLTYTFFDFVHRKLQLKKQLRQRDPLCKFYSQQFFVGLFET